MDKSDNDFSKGFHCTARTDVGMRRANNQDAYAVVMAENENAWLERGHLFVVADGMGAHAAGELASKLAVDGIGHLYTHYRDLPLAEALKRAIEETNREIHRRGNANPDFHNMGTTASVLVLSPLGAVVGHVGDSRVYRLRGETLEQLTFDHSLQWELRALGRLEGDADFARNVPKNVITRSLGPNPNVEVDMEGPFPIEVGDTFLLCSDGLSGQVEDEEIGQILLSLSPQEAADTLIDLANLRGGPDNITLIIAKVLDDALLETVGQASSTSGSLPRRGKRHRDAGLPAWTAAGILLFLALVLWFAEQPLPGGVATVIACAAAVYGFVRHFHCSASDPSSAPAPQMFGRGPHVQVSCPAGPAFVRSLADTLAQLKDAAQERDWDVDWQRFDGLEKSGEESVRCKRYREAIQSYSEAIRFMMRTLRQ